MHFDKDDLTAIAFLFEKENVAQHSEFEIETIRTSKFKNEATSKLELQLISGLENNRIEDRIGAYWALGKRFNSSLISKFRIWLEAELSQNNPIAVYQLFIVLSNMNEPVFGKNRQGSTGANEPDLNMRDGKAYLRQVNPSK